MTIEWMKSIRDTNTALYQEAKLGLFVQTWEAGEDLIIHGFLSVKEEINDGESETYILLAVYPSNDNRLDPDICLGWA